MLRSDCITTLTQFQGGKIRGIYISFCPILGERQKYKLLVGFGKKIKIFTELWGKYHMGKGGGGKNINYLDNIHPWANSMPTIGKLVNLDRLKFPFFFAYVAWRETVRSKYCIGVQKSICHLTVERHLPWYWL